MDQFLAEIRPFACNFPPTGWAFCNGQLLPLSQNTALFSLLGTQYGGDGKSTFALPNLQGAVPIGAGQGAGLSERWVGETGGTRAVTLLESEIPHHTHALRANAAPADESRPSGDAVLARSAGGELYRLAAGAPLTPMAPEALVPAGGSQPHNTMQPYLVINYCIALQGIFPPRG